MNIQYFKFITSVIAIFIAITLLIVAIYNKQKHTDNKTAMQLIFAIDIVRHGDRAPISHLPHFSKHWQNQPTGVLTQRGEEDSFKLGKKLANYYITQKHLLSKQYNEDSIVISTSNKQRTKKTAEQIIGGMYPNVQNAKIESPDKNNPLRPESFSHHSLLKSFYKNTSPSTIREMNNTIKEINKILKTNFTIEDIGKLEDNIAVNNAHNLKNIPNLSQEYYTKLSIFGNIALFNAMKPLQISCDTGLPLVNNILTLLNGATINKNPKYVLYITHDIMMLGLMNLIMSRQETLPPYLARIQIELFQNASKKLYVKLSYNNKTLKLCGATLCSLDKFQAYLNNKLRPCYNL